MNLKQFRKFILLLKHNKDEELKLPMDAHLPRITILPKEIFGLLLWLSLSKLFEFKKKFDQFDPFAFHYDVAKTNETW